jgi:hypothetical protein
MANITHTSTGATNTPRLLEVIGSVMALPLQEHLAFDFQIDNGIVMNESGIGGKWYDRITPAKYMSGDLHTLDNTILLNGMPTLKFPAYVGYEETQAYLGGATTFYPTSQTPSNRKYVMAVLFKENTHTGGGDTIFSPNCWTGYSEGTIGRTEIMINVSGGGVRSLGFVVQHTGYSSYIRTTVNSVITVGWHLAIWYIDLVGGTNVIWLDGSEIHNDSISTTFTAGSISEANTFGGIGRSGNYGGSRYVGNIAAAIGWKYTVPAWGETEFQATHDYLMNKYGLT